MHTPPQRATVSHVQHPRLDSRNHTTIQRPEPRANGVTLSAPFALPRLPVDVQTHTVTVDALSHIVYCEVI